MNETEGRHTRSPAFLEFLPTTETATVPVRSFDLIAPIPQDDTQRLEALHALHAFETSLDPHFQQLVELTSKTFETPISLVSLVDTNRQWFKARVGLPAEETPRDVAFCAHAILSDEPLIVEDATQDQRFSENPLVLGEPHIRFYAGAPLISSAGYRLGTLCAIDTKPRKVNALQVAALQTLAAIAVRSLNIQSELINATSELLYQS